MMMHNWDEEFVEQLVTYILEMNGQLYVVENVPARVSVETGERLFAPETVERLQALIWGDEAPTRKIEVPVFEFTA